MLPAHPSFLEATGIWLKVAALSFGGPAGQIAVMHRVLVEDKKWISEQRFLHALNYCMLLPGPEAQQLATYMGWLLHGTAGGLVAGGLFILPGFLAILALSIFYVFYQEAMLVTALLFGMKSAVLAIVVEAVVRIGKRALRNNLMTLIAASAFAALFFFEVPFPAVVVGAALIGVGAGRIWPEAFAASTLPPTTAVVDRLAAPAGASLRRSLVVIAAWVALWAIPFVLLIPRLGTSHVLVTEGLFFTKAAMVTFGGAYSVLTYIGQQAVEVYGWLQPGEMLDGLGMAETTPGPLIQVVQFVGFLGAYRNSQPFDPVTAGILGSLITTWVTYTPCFLWIFLGAPYIESLRTNRTATTALSAITAAVVGVILNLALWFALHVSFASITEVHHFGIRLLVPQPDSARYASIAISAISFFVMFGLHWSMMRTLVVGMSAGLLYHIAAWP